MDTQFLISIAAGICLSAACGLKIFVPPLAMGLASKTGLLTLPTQTEWLGTWPAITVLTFALLFEFIAFCIPVFGNFLDLIATPLAIVTGTLLMKSQIVELSPVVSWTLAIAGGGTASGIVQFVTAMIRAGTSAFTAGTSNIFFAIFELFTAVFIAILTLLAPLLCLAIVLILVLGLIRTLLNRGKKLRVFMDSKESLSNGT